MGYEFLESIKENRGRASRMRSAARLQQQDMEMLRMLVGDNTLHRVEYKRTMDKIRSAINQYEAEARAADAEADKVVQMLPIDGVLYAHYALGLTWEEVAYQKEHSVRYTYRLREKELQTILNKNATGKGDGDALR